MSPQVIKQSYQNLVIKISYISSNKTTYKR